MRFVSQSSGPFKDIRRVGSPTVPSCVVENWKLGANQKSRPNPQQNLIPGANMNRKRTRLVGSVLPLFFFLQMAGIYAQTSPRNPERDRTDSSIQASQLVDINSASKEQLDALPGIGEAYAQKIINGRPYRTKRDLLSKSVVPESTYNHISSQITARRTTGSSVDDRPTSSEPKSRNDAAEGRSSSRGSTSQVKVGVKQPRRSQMQVRCG